MKRPYSRMLVAVAAVVIFTGCSTPSRPSSCADEIERTINAITTLYQDSHEQVTVSNEVRNAFVSDSEFVESAERLLLHYANHENPDVRTTAAGCLAQFGTAKALTRALEIAKTEELPQSRALLWQVIAGLTEGPRSSHAAGGLWGFNSVLTNPELVMTISSCTAKPARHLLPLGFPAAEIEQAVIEQYLKDEGTWDIHVVDRIPFVPFYKEHNTITRTVRQAIAEAVEFLAYENNRLAKAFEEFSKHSNPAISEPAKDVVNTVKAWKAIEQDIKENATPAP